MTNVDFDDSDNYDDFEITISPITWGMLIEMGVVDTPAPQQEEEWDY